MPAGYTTLGNGVHSQDTDYSDILRFGLTKSLSRGRDLLSPWLKG